MARYEFKLPDIGEGIAEAEIVAWHVKVGDTIAEDQQIADMMTDKATVEMESPVAGKVLELAGEVGDQIPIGSVLAVIETEGADRAAQPADDSKDERPLADGAIEATPEQAHEIPVVAVDETSAAPAQPAAPRVEPEVAEKEPMAKAQVLASPAVRRTSSRSRHRSRTGSHQPATASAMQTSTPTCFTTAAASRPAALRLRATTKRSRSSASGARSLKTWRRRTGAFSILRWSRNMTSPRSRKRGR